MQLKRSANYSNVCDFYQRIFSNKNCSSKYYIQTWPFNSIILQCIAYTQARICGSVLLRTTLKVSLFYYTSYNIIQIDFNKYDKNVK